MDRKGALLVMFDLPSVKKEQQKAYRKFKKNLMKCGYRMIQESMYVKLLHNISDSQTEISRIELFAPNEGQVQVLPLSLLNFKKMESVCGAPFDMKFFSDDIVYL